ncbi:hypothetical protein IQ254_16795 [Nodosilinea sp. LEGE 07088]|uniref:hypothetical protein n=1 Tax=Nodosilinea sp. LEGE 07088 TaxID=2777968 RepID=UPI0018823E7D|nr:hypothetical protein [Nodosilinea sp. LEGE 07088]MBE9138832.1 hypothetical protein [Nodosilinea sp. LEGE 07088]
MSTETAPLALTEVQWQVAHAIARQLVIEGTDVNELRKTISYLREYVDRKDAGKAFFDYLKTLVRRGNQIGHSKQTVNYYKSLDAACEKYLKDYQDKAAQMLMILGWAARLVQYYGKGVPTGEIQKIEVMSEREAEIQAVTQAHTFEVGQELSATVAAIKGNKVTYEILDTIRLTQKEPKLVGKLSEGQEVSVCIEELKDDGSIKRVKGIR